jgi:hypothetical protein
VLYRFARANYTLKLLQHLLGFDCTLIDLRRPMLNRAAQRVGAAISRVTSTTRHLTHSEAKPLTKTFARFCTRDINYLQLGFLYRELHNVPLKEAVHAVTQIA